jgi:hypothetical protein
MVGAKVGELEGYADSAVISKINVPDGELPSYHRAQHLPTLVVTVCKHDK